MNNLHYKVITIRQFAVSVYRRGHHVSPYIIALDWEKSIDKNITVPFDIQCISKNPKVTQWIKVFDSFDLPKDKPISSFFRIPHIDQLFPYFAQVEYILEKTLASCFVKGEWVANRALSERVVVKENIADEEETIGTEQPTDTGRSMVTCREPANAEEQMDIDGPVKTKQPIRTDQTLQTQRLQHTASSNIIYIDEIDEVEESGESVLTSNVPALSTNDINSVIVIHDSEVTQTTPRNMNQTEESIVILSSESNNIEIIESTDISPLKRTISTTFDVPEKRVKRELVQSVPMTDLSKEELKEKLDHHLNRLYSIANDERTSTFGRINALSNLRSLCYIRHCDS